MTQEEMPIDPSVLRSRKMAEAGGMVAGLVFVISGILKALDAEAFANTIGSYGFPSLEFMAPVIVTGEVWLGLWLGLAVRLRRSALVALVVVAVFTLLYTYALVFHGVTDCGCFGRSSLNTVPWVLYAKNVLLMVILGYVAVKADDVAKTSLWIHAVVTLAVAFTAWEAGDTRVKPEPEPDFNAYDTPVAVKDHALGEFVKLSPDSTYAVYVFSYTCPHCQGSVGNVNEYARLGLVDKVVGLGMGSDEQLEKFRKAFGPRFEISGHGKELAKVSEDMPIVYLVRNDSIVFSWLGDMPPADMLKLAFPPVGK